MLTFDSQGLLPVVVVDDTTGDVLMVASMSQESLRLTQETGYVHFFSRSRQKIWRKGEQSGNIQEVRGIFVNCEENSLLVRVLQHGGAACHEGYLSCYHRQLLPDGSYKTIAERIFDPAEVYHQTAEEPVLALVEQVNEDKIDMQKQLEDSLRQLYGVYLYLRDHDLTTESHTSRLLHERSRSYLASRLADELQELSGVQTGEHVHAGRKEDTVLEGSQVGYWLFLIASSDMIAFDDFNPHEAVWHGYTAGYSDERALEVRQECLQLLEESDPTQVAQALYLGFTVIGWACAIADVDPLAPAEYDLEQMRHKGLVA